MNTNIENVKIMNSLQEAFCVLIVEIPRGENQENVSYQTLRRNVKKNMNGGAAGHETAIIII